MDDQNQNNMFMPTQGEDTSTQPPRFHRPHISQEPINDAEPEYVTRNRYQTLEDAQTGRKHMGVASSDPVYLKDAPLSKTARSMTTRRKRPKLDSKEVLDLSKP